MHVGLSLYSGLSHRLGSEVNEQPDSSRTAARVISFFMVVFLFSLMERFIKARQRSESRELFLYEFFQLLLDFAANDEAEIIIACRSCRVTGAMIKTVFVNLVEVDVLVADRALKILGDKLTEKIFSDLSECCFGHAVEVCKRLVRQPLGFRQPFLAPKF